MELSTQKRDYSGYHTVLTRPELIGYYSLDSNRQFQDDCSQLKYVKQKTIAPRQTEIDLNYNLDKSIKRIRNPAEPERLSCILQYLKSHRQVLDVFSKNPVTIDDIPFVCYRGLLREVSVQPFENSMPLRLAVSMANGVIYMHTLETPELRKSEDMSEREQTMCAWGYKFEQYLCCDDPFLDPDLSVPADENSEFNCVYSAMLGRHKLIYGAEMDGFLLNNECSEEYYQNWTKDNKINHDDKETVKHLRRHKQLELKTSRLIETERHNFSFKRYKCLKWWLQSYFAGNDVIVCGFRDDNGVVSKIRQYQTQDLPKHAEGWNPSVCLNFCEAFFSFVKQALVAELNRQGYSVPRDKNLRTCPVTHMVLHRKPRSSVFIDNPWVDENTKVLENWFIEMLPKT